jgi:hypothetical protein
VAIAAVLFLPPELVLADERCAGVPAIALIKPGAANGTRFLRRKSGVVRGPGFGRWDLSLFKNTKLTERVNLQFRAEAFNVWNHTNWSGVDGSMDNGTYGQVTSARDPRNIQFGLKLQF